MGVVAHSGEDDPIQRRVGVTVTSPVQPVACGLAGASWDGYASAEVSPRAFVLEPVWVVSCCDEETGGGVDPDPVKFEK